MPLILIVDDSPTELHVMQKALERNGFRTAAAADGAEGVRLARERGVTAPVIAGGIIPEADRPRLLAADVAAVYTPKDFELTKIMGEIVDLAIARRA